MASENETFDEVFAEAMNRKAVRDYRTGVSNGMKLGVVRCVEDVVDHYAMRFRDAHSREVEELRECLRQAYGDKTDTYAMKGDEVERWRKAINGEASAGGDTTSAVPDSDMRLAHYYLSIHRRMLENMRLGYMKRFEDSGREFTNERAKAERCQCDINTVDGWLERHMEHCVDGQKVNHLNGDYSTKKVIKF